MSEVEVSGYIPKMGNKAKSLQQQADKRYSNDVRQNSEDSLYDRAGDDLLDDSLVVSQSLQKATINESDAPNFI